MTAGRILRVEGQGPLTITVCERTTQRMRRFDADCVIQATGLDTAVDAASDHLLGQAMRTGLIVPDPLALGVASTPEGQLLDATGKPQPELYAIGPLLRGTLWECTAMAEIRALAQQVVNG